MAFKIFCLRLSSRWKKLAKVSLVKMALENLVIVLSVGVCSEGWEGGGVEEVNTRVQDQSLCRILLGLKRGNYLKTKANSSIHKH